MISIKVKILNSFWDKSVGLIGADPIYPVYFTTRWGVHTFGMSHAIDILVLDDRFRVVKFKSNMKPNSLFFWNPKFQNVLELPAGKYEYKLGQLILLK